MNKIAGLFFLLINMTASAQDRASLLRTALTNVNAKDTFLLRDSVLAHISYDAEGDTLALADLVRRKFITQADADHMLLQIRHHKPHMWTMDSIPHAVIVPSKITPAAALSPKKSGKAWSTYFKLYKSGYYEVSLPVFSLDGTYAIVYTTFQCGANCGNGGATLYHWENKAWKPVKNVFSWEK
ncbi:MAG TPA: hypothetical protein VI731_11230 [Bacteroidia bacterium]|nr:hypothetical protein [Bacteroidia bacterium]